MQNKYLLQSTISILCITLGFSGCSLFGTDKSSGEHTAPHTSVITDRKAYLEESLKEPRDPLPSETRIIVRLNPQFVLHLGAKHRVLSFEALNDAAEDLKNSTRDKWKKKPYRKALSAVLEQCVIDGYISDVSPGITLQVVYNPIDSNLPDARSIRKLSEIEHNIQTIASEITTAHGISAEINMALIENKE